MAWSAPEAPRRSQHELPWIWESTVSSLYQKPCSSSKSPHFVPLRNRTYCPIYGKSLFTFWLCQLFCRRPYRFSERYCTSLEIYCTGHNLIEHKSHFCHRTTLFILPAFMANQDKTGGHIFGINLPVNIVQSMIHGYALVTSSKTWINQRN